MKVFIFIDWFLYVSSTVLLTFSIRRTSGVSPSCLTSVILLLRRRVGIGVDDAAAYASDHSHAYVYLRLDAQGPL